MTNDRFALTPVADGAILLDLISGAILELNESAAFAWGHKLTGQPMESIVDAFADRYSLPRQEAADDVGRALNPVLYVEPPERTDFRYEQTASGYVFSFRNEAVFRLDPDGERVDLAGDVSETVVRLLRPLLRGLAPKLLALRGEAVVHAAAVDVDGTVMAFAGESGAGKTTTARALAAAGGRLVSEDQLLIWFNGSLASVSTRSEAAVSAWVEDAAPKLERLRTIECRDLGGATREGDVLALREIGFIDRGRRQGSSFSSESLRSWENAALVFRNLFYGSAERRGWQRQLDLASQIGQTTLGFRLTLPDGLERLASTMQALRTSCSLRS